MKVPQIRYRIPTFYGDDNWHVVNRDDEDLSLTNPLGIYIGITTEVIPSLGAFTKLQSNWCWRHNFNGITYNRFYSTSEGSNGSTAYTSLGVGITSTSTYYSVSPGAIVEYAYLTAANGSSGTNITKRSISSIRFSSYNSIYFDPTIDYYPTTAQSAIVCKFKAQYIADLPTGLYTINDRTITWNTSHPTYILLYGQECFTA